MARPVRRAVKWGLYSVLFLMTIVLETVFLGHTTIAGTKLSFVPVVIACIAAREGAEAGGLFALLCSIFWCFSGSDYGSLNIFILTLVGVTAGYFCGAHLTKNLLPTMLFCLIALALSQGGVYFLRLYLDAGVPPEGLLLVAKQVGLSVMSGPVFWLLARLIGRV